MSEALPLRPNLDWLRKTAKQQLREQRTRDPAAKLSDAQLTLARRFGFSSWRSFKSHIEQLQTSGATQSASVSDSDVASFLGAVGSGQLDTMRLMLTRTPQLVNTVGPHPYWEGRPQALHISIETARRDEFDLLLVSGADVNGNNELYEHTSPLALTVLWNQPEMRQELVARGARVGIVEALLLADDERVLSLLRRGKAALPKYKPNGGSILAMARTPLAIDRLLELEVPRDLKDRWGVPPIDALSRLGPEGRPLVEHLLAKGIEVTAQDYARMGDLENLRRLLDIDPTQNKKDDALCNAAAFGHYDLVEWLLKRGANVNRAAGGWSALHSAAWEGNLRMTKILVAAGADLSARDAEHNSTPAHCARVAIEVTNNSACREVADYLDSLEGT